MNEQQLLAALKQREQVLEPAARIMRWARSADPKTRIALVGGAVRDVALDLPVVDLDFVVEGNVAAVAQAVAEQLRGELTFHERFGTASIEPADDAFPGIARVDMARARTETYERPGALPSVEPSSLEDDLRRRDFTINAVAVLAPVEAEPDGASFTVLDPFDGLGDLQSRRLRTLHAESFVDDPTRLLRAARYAGRLGWDLNGEILVQGRAAVEAGALETVSAQRLWNELMLTFADTGSSAALCHLASLGVFSALGLDPQLEPVAAAAEAGDFETATAALMGDESNWNRLFAGAVPRKTSRAVLALL